MQTRPRSNSFTGPGTTTSGGAAVVSNTMSSGVRAQFLLPPSPQLTEGRSSDFFIRARGRNSDPWDRGMAKYCLSGSVFLQKMISGSNWQAMGTATKKIYDVGECDGEMLNRIIEQAFSQQAPTFTFNTPMECLNFVQIIDFLSIDPKVDRWSRIADFRDTAITQLRATKLENLDQGDAEEFGARLLAYQSILPVDLLAQLAQQIVSRTENDLKQNDTAEMDQSLQGRLFFSLRICATLGSNSETFAGPDGLAMSSQLTPALTAVLQKTPDGLLSQHRDLLPELLGIFVQSILLPIPASLISTLERVGLCNSEQACSLSYWCLMTDQQEVIFTPEKLRDIGLDDLLPAHVMARMKARYLEDCTAIMPPHTDFGSDRRPEFEDRWLKIFRAYPDTVDHRHPHFKTSLLMWVAQSSRLAETVELLEAGADPFPAPSKENAAFEYAEDHPEIAQLIFDYSLIYAVRAKRSDLVDMLLQSGEVPRRDFTNKAGESALSLAQSQAAAGDTTMRDKLANVFGW